MQHTITIQAPAKINLTLDVLGTRPDGYHEIDSLMQTLSLADDIAIEMSDLPGVRLIVDGPEAGGVPTDGSNLAHKAAGLVLSEAGCASGVAIALTKHIPSQAGLGGGSSDAAAVLIGVNALLGKPFTGSELLPMARALGADVSFFLHGGFARVRGIGEIVEPLPGASEQEILIVKPRVGVSTAQAYRALDGLAGRMSARRTERALRSHRSPIRDLTRSRPPDLVPWREEGAHSYGMVARRLRWEGGSHPSPFSEQWTDGAIGNDFEAVVYDLYPAIASIRAALLDSGAKAVLLCGSGSCLAAFGGEYEGLIRAAQNETVAGAWRVRTTARDLDGWRSQLWKS